MKSAISASARRRLRQAVAQRGITLVEACVVMTIAVVLGSAAAPSLRDMVEMRRFERVATELISDLQFVRAESVARNQPLRLSRYATTGGSCYVVHSGDAAQCHCSQPGPAQCSGDAQELRTVRLPVDDRVSLTGTAHSVLFDPLHGTVSPTATLRVIGPSSGTGRGARAREVHHVINVTGRVRSCSPLGAIAGYRTC